MQVRLSGTPKGNVLDDGLDIILTRGSASQKVKCKSTEITSCQAQMTKLEQKSF